MSFRGGIDDIPGLGELALTLAKIPTLSNALAGYA